MATIFWNAKGILLIEYLQREYTITDQYYVRLINKFHDCIKGKGRRMSAREIWFHQDNTPVKTNFVSLRVIKNAGFELLVIFIYF